MPKLQFDNRPEDRAATGLPITLIIGLLLLLGGYVFAIGAIDKNPKTSRVYLPASASAEVQR
jgi:hypothetical protein